MRLAAWCSVLAGGLDPVGLVVFSPDSSLLATAGDDGRLRVWDTATGAMEAELEGAALGGANVVLGPSFSPDGSRVAASWRRVEGVTRQRPSDVVRILDLATGGPPLEIPTHTDSTSFSPDGERLALAAEDGVIVMEVATGDELFRFQPTTEPVLAVAWSPDGRWIASSGPGGQARVTDADTGERHLPLAGHTDAVRNFDWGPDGIRLATASLDGTARVWDITEAGAIEQLAVTAKDTQGGVNGVSFSPDGQRLLTGDVDVRAAKIWDVGISGGAEWVNLPTLPILRAPGGFSLPSTAVFTADGAGLVMTGDGVPAVVRGLAEGAPRRRLGEENSELPPEQVGAFAIAVNPAGDLIATTSFDAGPIHVWEAGSGEEAFAVSVGPSTGFFTNDLAWSPDGELLAVAGREAGQQRGAIRLFDRTGQQVAEIVEDPNFEAFEVDFSPDGQHLVANRLPSEGARDEPTSAGARVWDWATGEPVVDIPASIPDAVAFDPTGTRVATGGLDGAVHMWDAATGEQVGAFSGHTRDVRDVAFSADGDTLASASGDGTVRLWSAETGVQQLVLRGHDGRVDTVNFSPDGDRLVSVGAGEVRVWALDLDDLIDIAEDRLTRSFTDDECRQYLHVDTCPE